MRCQGRLHEILLKLNRKSISSQLKVLQKSTQGAERSHSMLHSRPLTFLVNWLAEARAGGDAEVVSMYDLEVSFSTLWSLSYRLSESLELFKRLSMSRLCKAFLAGLLNLTW